MSSIGVATSMFISILVMTVMILWENGFWARCRTRWWPRCPCCFRLCSGALAQQLMNHPGWGGCRRACGCGAFGPDPGNI